MSLPANTEYFREMKERNRLQTVAAHAEATRKLGHNEPCKCINCQPDNLCKCGHSHDGGPCDDCSCTIHRSIHTVAPEVCQHVHCECPEPHCFCNTVYCHN
jgi:hypothetical protein